MVIIELGSNIINAHQLLLNKIHKYVPAAPVYWLGPYARALGHLRLSEIQKVCRPLYNRCMLLRCDDVMGSDSLITYHFTGKKAQLWADTVTARINRCIRLQQRHALMHNIAISYMAVASRISFPLGHFFWRKTVQYSPGEGWLSQVLLKQPFLIASNR
jgi:hypothetical protein